MTGEQAAGRSARASLPTPGRTIELTVNGDTRTLSIEDRQLLVEVIRDSLQLTGTHIGCYNGDCGACTVELDGQIVKSCLVLAAAVDGAAITTIEGLSSDGELSVLQQAFWEQDTFQCGFCVAGHLFAARELLEASPDPSDDQIREALIGNLCRCTGYVRILTAIRQAAVAHSD